MGVGKQKGNMLKIGISVKAVYKAKFKKKTNRRNKSSLQINNQKFQQNLTNRRNRRRYNRIITTP